MGYMIIIVIFTITIIINDPVWVRSCLLPHWVQL